MLKPIETILDLAKSGYMPIEISKSRHYAAIGRLLVCFSNDLDARLQSLLRAQFSSGDEATVRVVVNAVRVGDAVAALRQIVHVRGLDEAIKGHIESLFVEIGTLRKLRDTVAHRGCLVNDDGFAFHNALTARTDEKIEVEFYTIEELGEFAEYAVRLGNRVAALSSVLIPLPVNPLQEAAVSLTMYQAMQEVLLALAKEGKISRAKYGHLWSLERDATNAISAYAKSLPSVDPKHMDLKHKAAIALARFYYELTVIGQSASPEIPERLKKGRREAMQL